MKRTVICGRVTSVKANGWGALVTVALSDRSARYDERTDRPMHFMHSSGSSQPLVGQTVKVTIENAREEG